MLTMRVFKTPGETGVKNFVKGMLALVLALVVFEGVSRIAATIFYDVTTPDPEDAAWYSFSPEYGWTGKPGYSGPVVERPEGARMFDESGFVAGEMQKLNNAPKRKILFIGDSKTFGYEIPKQHGMASLLETLLPDVATINLSLPAYSSYQGLLVATNIVPRNGGDVAVISFNFNDRRFVGSPGEEDGAAAFARYYETYQANARLQTLDVSYIYRLLRYLLRWMGLVRDEYALPAPVTIDALLPRVSRSNFRANLVGIVNVLREKGIVPVFLLLGDNPTHSIFLKKGLQQLQEGRLDSAINSLRTSEMLHNSSNLLSRKVLAQAYELTGDTTSAARYRQPFHPHRRFNGGDLIEFDSTYNDIMRDVARELSVELVDGAEVLNAEPSVFFDSCHFDERGHRRIAEVLATRMRSLLTSRQRAG